MIDPCLFTFHWSLSSELQACFGSGRHLKGFLVTDLYPDTLVRVAERRTREPCKRGFLFETLEPAGGISSLWYATHHHRCFPYRPNSMCLSAAFFVWDRLAGVHCSSVPPGHICRHVDGRSDGKGHLPTLPGNPRRKKWAVQSQASFCCCRCLFDPACRASVCACSDFRPPCLTLGCLLTNAAAGLWCVGLITLKPPALSDHATCVVKHACSCGGRFAPC